MKTLNLVYPEKSDIKYKLSQFPDGQQQVTILLPNGSELSDSSYKWSIPVQIKARLNNFKDLELICCVVASLRELGVKNIELYVPYFLGSRSDRKFEVGSNNYLKTVICPLINSLNFSSITVMDAHSDVLEACLNNYKKIGNIDLVKWALKGKDAILPLKSLDDCFLISPDAGAYKKITKLADDIGYTGNIITCSKVRDTDGKLSKTVVPLSTWDIYSGKDMIIVDDICDGGATFINIAKEIKAIQDNHSQLRANRGKIYLIVTHGIFSKGFEELNKYFDGIYCTNSYSNIPDAYNNGTKRYITNVKQYEVF